jgi:hypothetical protein
MDELTRSVRARERCDVKPSPLFEIAWQVDPRWHEITNGRSSAYRAEDKQGKGYRHFEPFICWVGTSTVQASEACALIPLLKGQPREAQNR